MLTLDLSPSIEQTIINNAKAQDLSVSEYILRHLPIAPKKDPNSLNAVAGLMKGKLPDGVVYQNQLRAEWDNVSD